MPVPHRSIYATALYIELERAAQVILIIIHRDFLSATPPIVSKTRPKTSRNDEIKTRFAAGEAVPSLASAFGVSQQRIRQIIQGKRK